MDDMNFDQTTPQDSGPPPAPTQRERRADTRHSCFRSGQIILEDKDSTFDCLLRNMSWFGARLETGAYISVPNQFKLALHNGDQPIRCKVIWRKHNALGLMFAQKTV